MGLFKQANCKAYKCRLVSGSSPQSSKATGNLHGSFKSQVPLGSADRNLLLHMSIHGKQSAKLAIPPESKSSQVCLDKTMP